MKWIGTRPTFRIFAGMTLLTGFCYLCFNTFYITKRTKAKTVDDDKKVNETEEKKEINDIEASNNAKNLNIIGNGIENLSGNVEVEMTRKHSGALNASFEADEEIRKGTKM